MAQSGAYGGGGSASNYSYASSGQQSSNYNYLSFFAAGSFGRRLEGQRSRDPTAPANLEEEKKRWKWIAGVCIASMFLVNIAAAIGLSRLKYQTSNAEAAFHGDLQAVIQHEMKHNLDKHCRPRYRKTKECSQAAAQIVLVANSDDDTVIWRGDNPLRKDFNRTTPGAFICKEFSIDQDGTNGRLRVPSRGMYQIHSHVSVHKMSSGESFQHEIRHHRFQWNDGVTVAEETLNRNCPSVSKGSTCFSSSLLATERLDKGDLIYVRFWVNEKEVNARKKDILLYDGHSTYFGFVKLGVTAC